jgi:hypothetical protein
VTWLYSTTLTLLSLLFVAEGRAQTTTDTHQPVHESLTGERACSSGDWRIASLAESKSLLEAYGYDSLPTRNCRAVDLAWLPSAHIVQFTGTQNTDVFVSLTFVRANNTSHLWLIPVNGGLYKHFDGEDDLHNKAALNELLQISGYKPNDSQIADLARLYMFFVSHSVGSNSKRSGPSPKGKWYDCTGNYEGWLDNSNLASCDGQTDAKRSAKLGA